MEGDNSADFSEFLHEHLSRMQKFSKISAVMILYSKLKSKLAFENFQKSSRT